MAIPSPIGTIGGLSKGFDFGGAGNWITAGFDIAKSIFPKAFGGGSNFKGMRSQMDLQRQFTNKSFHDKMAFAKQYGISKLAMLGSPAVQSPSFSVGGTGGGYDSSMSDMGQSLGRAVSALGTRSERAAQETITGLQVEGAQLDNEYKRALIRNMNSAGTPPPFPSGGNADGVADSRYPVQAKMAMGYGDTAPLLRVGRDAYGMPIRVYNDDLGDNEILQALSALRYSVPDYAYNAGVMQGRTPNSFMNRVRRGYGRTLDYFRSRNQYNR